MCRFEDQFGQVTIYPNRTSSVNQGPYCFVSHPIREITRLAETLQNRDFGPDDLIFIKIKTYFDGKRLEVRTAKALEERDNGDLYWYPYPFAFIKDHIEGKFKFLPIRLHQFEDLWKGHDKESLKADDYEVTKPWTMDINLNITGDCWQQAPTFTNKRGEYIGPIGEWFKEAVMAHLSVYLHDLISECQNQFGGMWVENPYRKVCYVEKADSWRHSAPYIIVECCHFKEKKLTNDGALPIECKTVSESVEKVKLVVRISVVIIFLFLPLSVRLIPTRREPYKVMDTKKESTKFSRKHDVEADGNENDQLEAEAFIPR